MRKRTKIVGVPPHVREVPIPRDRHQLVIHLGEGEEGRRVPREESFRMTEENIKRLTYASRLLKNLTRKRTATTARERRE